MAYSLLVWSSWLILQIITVCSGCVAPVPQAIVEVKETDSPGTVLLRMPETSGTSSSSWSIRIKYPIDHAAYLKNFLSVVQDSGSNSYGWRVVLARTLDLEQIRDEINYVLSDFTLELDCTLNQRPVTYERTVVINEVSEYSPVFSDHLPVFNVSEVAFMQTIVARLADYVTDQDVQNNGDPTDIREFYTTPYQGDEIESGDGKFGVSTSGNLILRKPLDYEKGDRMFAINVTAQDTGGLTDWSVVKFAVVNANDNVPSFTTTSSYTTVEVTEYRATVEPSYTGLITSLEPGSIQATDADNDVITYHIVTGHPHNHWSYIQLDPYSGNLSVIKPVQDETISHFTIIIEARDGVYGSQSGPTDSEDFHSTTASLLIFVSGRTIDFPATPRSGGSPSSPSTPSISSSSSSFNTDALFISVIILSTLLLILIIAIIVMACKIRRNKRKRAMSHLTRSNNPKDRRPSDWSIQMRHIEGEAEKDFIHSLSRNDPHVNQSFNHEANDDVFVTGITPMPHPSTGQQNNHTLADDYDNISRGIVPYYADKGIASSPQPTSVESSSSASTLPRHPSTILSTNFGSQSRMDVNEAIDSLNILTSVRPINDARHPGPGTGTLKYMKGREDLNEVGQIIKKDAGSKLYDRENGEKITSFTTKDNNYSRGVRRAAPNDSRSSVEGVTVFGKEMDVAVIPFDHNSNIDENAFVFQ